MKQGNAITIPTSLFQLADAVGEALGRARDSDLKAQLSRLDKECEDAKQAWLLRGNLGARRASIRMRKCRRMRDGRRA